MIELVDVSKVYGDRTILQPMSLKIESQRRFALIGPSGCGKSTLLRIVLGLIHPDTGKVVLNGVTMTPENSRELRLRIGYVIQDGGLFPHLTAFGNVSLMAAHLGWEREKIRARVLELAQLVQLPQDLLQRYPAEMSGGQRQRVGIMRSLMLDPPLLIFDEPMGALDPLVRFHLQDDLRNIFRSLDKTVLLVTHDMGEAAFLAEEIALLKDGRVVQKGSYEDLVQRPADPFVSEFLRAQRMDPVSS
ncbi:ABC transporter ATP-binding protein [bacterium SCN 62-11]|nr:ATP-binding cassette domain-containing protein [Candidatus Eremiobacteraeota bacterium]ODT74663.1 MAG: ABC transporter ATP-binding protein [bacterium SCN 62-11]